MQSDLIWMTVGLSLAVMAPAAASDPDERARMTGALAYTPLDVRFDEVPVRDALEALSQAIAIPIVGRFADARHPFGIDGGLTVSLRLEGVEAQLALEAVIDQCETFEPCTWQLRTGFVEVGTKERLGVPAASETRLYPIRDLLIEPQDGHDPMPDFDELPFATAVLSKPPRTRDRKRPEELAREIIQSIVELVEPGNWDFGQHGDVDEQGRPLGSSTSPVPDARSAPDAPRATRARPAYVQPAGGKIARIRFLRESIIIHAPDYVHRQVVTQPAAPPPRLSEQERADRSSLASAHERATVVVLTPEPGVEQGASR